jgi:hypothetical protein
MDFFKDDRLGLSMSYDREAIERNHTKINGWVLSAQDSFGTYCHHNGTDFEIALWKEKGDMIKLEEDEVVMRYCPVKMVEEIKTFLTNYKGIPKEKEVRKEVLRLSKIYKEI